MNTKTKYINNINKLTPGRSTHCGAYGKITLHHSADDDTYGKRIFTVSHSTKIHNGGCYTFGTIRRAIMAK